MRSFVFVALLLLGGCGGESTSEPGAAGANAGGGAGWSGTGGAQTGGSGGSTTGGSGGSITGGSGGAPTGGAGGMAGAQACNDPAAKTCSGPGQCVLVAPSCCLCGMPELTDYVALNEVSAPECTCKGPACGCASAENPNLAASCEAGQCAAWDVRQRDDLSGCTSDAECRLRDGLRCCESCTPSIWGLVATRIDAELKVEQAMCMPNEACSKCAVQYPPGVTAVCTAGRCQVLPPK